MRCPSCERPVPLGASVCEACLTLIDEVDAAPSRPPPRRSEGAGALDDSGPASSAEETPAAGPTDSPDLEPAEAAREGATCSEHPEMPAAATCDRCGRFVCIRCAPDFLSEGRSTCPACLAREEGAPLPIGGWLILPAIGLVVWPLVELATVLLLLNSDFGLLVGRTAPVVALSVDLLATVFVAVFFFQKKKVAPALMIGLMVLRVVAQVVASGQLKWSWALWAGIWTAYFLTSDRVRRTFVRE